MTRAWLREDQPDLAAEKILDAAEKAFIERGVSAAGMAEIAEAAGCSRGTLYRYFRNRHELHLAYVKRAAREIQERVRAQVAGVADPEARLVEYVVCAVREVRQNPGTAAWFKPSASGLGARMSQASEVMETLMSTLTEPPFGSRLSAEESRLRARWIIRIIVSLLSNPGESEDEERALLERFVAPGLGGEKGH
ncbi:MAG: TetR/AcrR family transcriptional regulator [Myxococcota bacterium]|nr:TetR/AcrR family transcriptional regulator [Myxococcota bacterium]